MWRLHYCVVWKHMGYIWYNAHYFINRELAFEKNRREGSVINNNKHFWMIPFIQYTLITNISLISSVTSIIIMHYTQSIQVHMLWLCKSHAAVCYHTEERDRERRRRNKPAGKHPTFPGLHVSVIVCIHASRVLADCHNVDCVGSSDQLHRTRDKIATISSLSRGFRGIFHTSAMRGLGHVALGRSAGEHPWPAMFWHITLDWWISTFYYCRILALGHLMYR